MLPPGFTLVPADRVQVRFPGRGGSTRTTWARGGWARRAPCRRIVSARHTVTGGLRLEHEGTFDLGAKSNFDFDTVLPLPEYQDLPGAVPEASRTVFSLYAQDAWSPTERIGVTAGLRLDHYTRLRRHREPAPGRGVPRAPGPHRQDGLRPRRALAELPGAVLLDAAAPSRTRTSTPRASTPWTRPRSSAGATCACAPPVYRTRAARRDRARGERLRARDRAPPSSTPRASTPAASSSRRRATSRATAPCSSSTACRAPRTPPPASGSPASPPTSAPRGHLPRGRVPALSPSLTFARAGRGRRRSAAGARRLRARGRRGARPQLPPRLELTPSCTTSSARHYFDPSPLGGLPGDYPRPGRAIFVKAKYRF